MILTKIQGGLGNQMFQWAFGRSLALEKNTYMHVYLDGYENQQGITPRKFELNLFKNLKYQECDKKNLPTNQNWVVLKDEFNYLNLLSRTSNLSDCNFYLDGYWQSEYYFQRYKSVIYSDFSPSFDEVFRCKSLIEPDSVSIHIRRTDYVTSNGYHPIQPISYFSSAIDMIGDYNKLYVFSDEIDWCKTNLNFDRMVFMEGRTAIEDMRLMSFCKHNIIANSSFSWWAAWLNQNPYKMIIAPSKWFGPQANLWTGDIIPREWITI